LVILSICWKNILLVVLYLHKLLVISPQSLVLIIQRSMD
jgi:hypothetical protein